MWFITKTLGHIHLCNSPLHLWDGQKGDGEYLHAWDYHLFQWRWGAIWEKECSPHQTCSRSPASCHCSNTLACQVPAWDLCSRATKDKNIFIMLSVYHCVLNYFLVVLDQMLPVGHGLSTHGITQNTPKCILTIVYIHLWFWRKANCLKI